MKIDHMMRAREVGFVRYGFGTDPEYKSRFSYDPNEPEIYFKQKTTTLVKYGKQGVKREVNVSVWLLME